MGTGVALQVCARARMCVCVAASTRARANGLSGRYYVLKRADYKEINCNRLVTLLLFGPD